MTHYLRLTLLTSAALLAACDEDNPLYCEGHPEDTTRCPTPDAGKCTTNDQCPGEVCDTASGDCVECTTAQASACESTTPVCGDNNTCTACTSHDQCTASNVCLPTGACADESQVAFVSAAGTGTACTKAAPCPLLATAVGKTLPYIKIAADGAKKDTAPVVIDAKAVTILAAPGAVLDRDGDGPILEVKSNGADVQIFDLQISGASGTTDANGIVLTPNVGNPKLALTRVKVTGNAGIGVAASGGSLSVAQSTVTGNASIGISSTGGALSVAQCTISNNTGGGVFVDNATFAVVGNVFSGNGSTSSLKGGAVVNGAQSTANRFEFNSFNNNIAQAGVAAGLQCVVLNFTARNNILSDNGTLSNQVQVGGSCAHTYSVVRPGALPAGAGNSGSDPMFVNTTTGDLHISATSPARGAADPASNLSGAAALDIDGQPRTNPADIGADEVP